MNQFSIQDTGSMREIYVITIDDYNRLKGKNETLAEDEVMISMPKNEKTYSYDTITVEGGSTWKVKSTLDKFSLYGADAATMIPSMYIFVPDQNAMKEIYAAQAEYYQDAASEIEQYYGFDLNCPSEEQIEITGEMFDRFAQAQNENSGFCRANQPGRKRAGTFLVPGYVRRPFLPGNYSRNRIYRRHGNYYLL